MLVMALLAGVLGWQGLLRRADALERARADTAQQVKIQTARTALMIADTNAGTDVLTGADPTQFRYKLFAFEAQPALLGLVTAARTDADAARLATANKYLTLYAMQVESARTLAQEGQDEDAAQTLTAASQMLREEVLSRLNEVQQASRDRLDDDRSAADLAPVIALLAGIVAVLVIVGVHLWLTRRTRRLLNLGLLGCVVVLIVATVAGAVVVADSREKVVDAEENALQVVDFVVETRFSAFSARSGEALAALNGTTVKEEPAWAESMENADWYLGKAAEGQPARIGQDVDRIAKGLAQYRWVHGRLLEEAEKGNPRGVRRITSNPAENGSVGSFEAFDAYSGALLARQVQAADDAWAAAGQNLRLVGWLTLVVGLLGAVLAWAGIAARRREYR
ncbi:hypothetical protein Kisp01_30430 [Kineosporia sp. NBRC 101677]|nr:hypothetical protein Kisp01_30430 [Kineosporia sp. NBRC 101677]